MSREQAREVKYPGRRGDIIAGLELLSTLTMDSVAHRPGALTDAVQWVVDDTFWDMHDPSDSIGWKLRDEQEATAIKTLLDPLMHILEHLGPVEPDIAYVSHRRWPEVVATANAARLLMTANDTHAR